MTVCLAAPALADRDWPDGHRARHGHDPFPQWRGDKWGGPQWSGARDPHVHPYPRHHGPRVLVVPGFSGLARRGPPAAIASGFEPPARFAYYCNDPPGYFPYVSACAGPWTETGAPPSR